MWDVDRKVIIFGFVLMLLISLSGCTEDDKDYDEYIHDCGGDSRPIPLDIDSIHEWGVFEQSYNDAEIVFTGPSPKNFSEPQDLVETEDSKPVIYFYGIGQGNISVNIETNATDIVTIPQALVSEGNITWNIELKSNASIISSEGPLVPVDSDGIAYDYLFYEGKDFRSMDIYANVTVKDDLVDFNISNIGDSNITDVYIWYHSGESENEFNLLNIQKIEMGSSFTQSFEINSTVSLNEARNSLKDDLLSRGLTNNEAEDLLTYWVDGETDSNGIKTNLTWFEKREDEYAQVIYFIEKSEYDELLPVQISSEGYDDYYGIGRRVGIISVTDIPVIK